MSSLSISLKGISVKYPYSLTKVMDKVMLGKGGIYIILLDEKVIYIGKGKELQKRLYAPVAYVFL